ncbi:hypothetical protein [Salirhabdus salicampi]|uniref:hypothetical protein n=1 Tax=Salirhabdus salicampi TaxID=476102 RepID=UPI0020C1E73D|nr:hypothetical protein [Salirhabdus salicampi]MCP8615954.1 hypothetical protein [Salirhabdus salicampi]
MRKGMLISILVFICFVVLYHVLSINSFIIDDGVLTVSRVFLGFIQWVYVLPLLFVLKRRNVHRRFINGFLLSAFFISLANVGLFVWMIIDPSQFI